MRDIEIEIPDQTDEILFGQIIAKHTNLKIGFGGVEKLSNQRSADIMSTVRLTDNGFGRNT